MPRPCAFSALILLALTPAPVAQGATCYAITSDYQVVTFQTGSPSTFSNSVPLTGLMGTETIRGCDIRPANGVLYMITRDQTDTDRIYTLNPTTGAATFVVALNQNLDGAFFGMDFDPVADRIRVVSSARQNVRVHPTTGEVTIDSILAYSGADPNAGQFPSVFGCAFSNNLAGSGTTSLYGIDAGTDALVLQNPANDGVLTTVGPLGLDIGGSIAFDIAPSPVNHAYAALPVRLQETDLFLIDLATGHASLIGEVGANVVLRGFTVAPGYPQTAFSRQQNISIVANGVGYQELSYNYTTGQISVTPYSSANGPAARLFPFVEWTGVFHYDYGAAAFTHAVYSRQHPL